ncbi:MAG: DUF2867 domain-containing protein [Dysgonomonas sp.]
MNVRKGNIPQNSLVNKDLAVDYSDVYFCTVLGGLNITPDDIQVAFWTDSPKWVDNLFKLRNWIVKPFGLQQGEGKNAQKFEECIRTGGKLSFVSVPDKSPNETILCLTDKHLTAYLSVYIEDMEDDKRTIYLATLVNFHNMLGYIYFYTIYPFHHIVVKKILERTIKKLLKSN